MVEEIKKWNLTDSLEFINDFNSKLKPNGWFLCLAGSILYKKETDDLDIVAVPMDLTNRSLLKLLFLFGCKGCSLIKTPTQMRDTWRTKGLKDNKTVCRLKDREGRLIDLIMPTENLI